MNDTPRIDQPNMVATIRVLSTWTVERIARLSPATLDAVFAACIDAARVYPEAIIKVGYGPDGVEVEVFARDNPGWLLVRWAWLYDYPE